jgi:23S rRNA pseudouridine2605 synthase
MNDADDLSLPIPPASTDAEPAPARPRRRKAAAAPSAADSAEPTVQPDPPASPQAEAHAQSSEGEQPGPANAEAAGDGAGDGADTPAGRARRKRRRGRKGRKEGVDGTPAAPQDGASEPPPMADAPDTRELFEHVTGDAFDAAEPEAAVGEPTEAPADAAAGTDAGPAGEPRRILAPDADAPKLQKVLAQSGLGSRRDLEQWIAEGRVTVNDAPAHVGQRVSWGDRVAIDGKPVRVRIAPLPTRVLAYHKPVGEVCTLDDPEGRPTVFRRLPRLVHGKWQSVGRLDINTEGLLLFTTSGELANRLMHPRFGVEREYAVRVLGTLGDEQRAKLLEGLPIEGQTAAFLRIEDGGGEGVNRWYRVVIGEGRNREVRRLFDAVGLAVSRLIRIRYGAIVLPRGLKRGAAVDLAEDDVKLLRRLTGLGVRGEAREGRDGAPAREGRDGRDGRDSREARPPREPRPPKPPRMQETREPREPREPREARPPREVREVIPSPLTSGRPVGPKRRGGRQSLHEGFGDAALRAREHELEPVPHEDDYVEPPGEFTNIPNPLQQTFDRRAMRDAQRPQRELGDDAPIPNPLQQTYDQRALKAARAAPVRENDEDGPIPNPLQQTYDKRFNKGGGKPMGGPGGPGGPGAGPRGPRAKKRGGGPKPGGGAGAQPDPMRTAVGYIGGDALLGKKAGPGGGRGGRRGGPRGPHKGR